MEEIRGKSSIDIKEQLEIKEKLQYFQDMILEKKLKVKAGIDKFLHKLPAMKIFRYPFGIEIEDAVCPTLCHFLLKESEKVLHTKAKRGTFMNSFSSLFKGEVWMLNSSLLSEILFERVSAIHGLEVEGWKRSSISNHFRCTKYCQGNSFPEHRDAAIGRFLELSNDFVGIPRR